jgi:hypothetical protein
MKASKAKEEKARRQEREERENAQKRPNPTSPPRATAPPVKPIASQRGPEVRLREGEPPAV